ncbi:hypothetical protein IMG5_036360 [Ichthyophthirius multifiliis]|uniref:Uncharacterized protein n=1 Tax=Ichthyophthirius multifiliis TaxID=5932 RepID=G0QLT9_ICHMU|nr:hypothetical protein IMG5_036360 [Ichthyophthirius multifiliis]EGR33820.1 hypothetical protein IMG5_036360 [Ichthyophthirius multifiliis]|eukprot:XP_004039044.1 hypothetical protein IMG5_036360 [Ichthyophthirius multifiliis]
MVRPRMILTKLKETKAKNSQLNQNLHDYDDKFQRTSAKLFIVIGLIIAGTFYSQASILNFFQTQTQQQIDEKNLQNKQKSIEEGQLLLKKHLNKEKK